MASPHVNVARSASEMDRVAGLWTELLKSRVHTIFQRFSWNRLAAEVFRDRMTPNVVWVEGHAGAAIIPAAIHHKTDQVELIGEALFDYRDVLHTGDRDILRQAWQELASYGKPLSVSAIHGAAARDGWEEFPVTTFANAPQVDRSLVDENSFRMAHSRLGRQMRRLKRLGASLHVYSGKDSEAIRRLYECKRAHFAQDNLFFDQRRCDFIVAAAGLEASGCEMFALETADGKLLAGLLTFRDGEVRRFYTIYFDPEWARYSPGVALLYEVTARSLDEGLSCDYMTGEQPYKLRLANASQRLFKLELSAQQLSKTMAEVVRSVA